MAPNSAGLYTTTGIAPYPVLHSVCLLHLIFLPPSQCVCMCVCVCVYMCVMCTHLCVYVAMCIHP